jgi:hypothetical protein
MRLLGFLFIRLGVWLIGRSVGVRRQTFKAVAGEDLEPGIMVRIGEDGKVYPYETRERN